MNGPTPPLRMPEAEQEVDRARVTRLLGAYPELAAGTVRLLGVGWDNTVWLVDETWTVRFPRRAAALPLLDRELRVLRALAGRLPLPVPEPAHVAGPYDDFPWPSWAAPVSRGSSWPTPGWPTRTGASSASRWAVPRRAARSGTSAGLPVDPNRRADMASGCPGPARPSARAVELGLLAGVPEGFEALAAEALGLPAPITAGALPRRPPPASRAGGRTRGHGRHRLG